MVFSSVPFLFYFLPIILVLYYFVPRKGKNFVLFISSLIFYAWGEPIYVTIMLFSTVVDYTHGMLIEKFLDSGQKYKAKLTLISSVIINLSLLGLFKYSDFFIANINTLTGMAIPLLKLSLPIGISFYTFQTMSYSIDVYRGKAKAQKNIISFGTYVAFFPQLIAGPIVQYKTVAEQLENRAETSDMVAYGIKRFMQGLGKKVLLANNIGYLWTQISAMNIETIPVFTAWMGIIAFAFQMYFDFSGYSDMAIGLGRMLGFTFLENFDHPYVSKSITEFWRRWHISLGSWFREYVYIPLGGNKKGRFRTVFNIFIVWMLTGFWHGASWNFVAWGLYFGALLMIEKIFLLKSLRNLPSVLGHLYTMLLVLIGWTIFAFDDFSMGLGYLRVLFGFGANQFWNSETIYILLSYAILFIVLILGSTGMPKKIYAYVFHRERAMLAEGVFEVISMVLIFVFSTAYVINSTYNPFLYFRF